MLNRTLAMVKPFALGLFAVAFFAMAQGVARADEVTVSGTSSGTVTGVPQLTFAGTRLAGRFVDRFGSRAAVKIATPPLCVLLLAPALADELVGLTAALAGIGLVGGFLDVAMNAQAVAVERRYERPIMSGLHGLWSVGLLLGAVGGAAAAALDAAPVWHFALVAALALVPSLLVPAGLLPAAAEALPPGLAGDQRGWLRLLLAPAVLLLGLIAFGSFLGEGAAADWSAVYLRDDLHAGGGVAASAFVAFSLAMAASRFVADRLALRFGAAAVVRVGALVAAGGLAFGLAVHRPWAAVAGFALLGLGLAPIVPIVFSAAGRTGLGATGVILGRVVTMGYVGGVVGPVVIGVLADAVGLRTALLLPVALAAATAALAGTVSSAGGGLR